jgi:hypothetical protein
MKKILMFQWFDCKDKIRKQELTDCVNHNLDIGFDEVIIFNDSVDPSFQGQNIKNVSTNSRITYKDYIDVVKNPSNYGSLVVLTNTDIKLDSNILFLDEIIKEETLIALSRYENNGALAETPWCTQDVWAMLSQPIHKSVIHQCDIPLGMPGCEMRFSEIIFNTGFAVFNPCLDVKNIHIHTNQTPHLDENRMYGAYLFSPACTFEDIRTRNTKALPSPQYWTSFTSKLFSIH